jgi:hypothetical protein
MQSLGGISAMFNPWKNALMAKFLYENSGSKIPNTPGFPWYGTKYLSSGGFAGVFDKGGTVPGQRGQAVPILAHAGEWILNDDQKMRLAAAMGTSLGKLRDILGFRGGPSSFQGGGEVRAPFAAFGPKAAENLRYEERLEVLRRIRQRAEDAGEKKRVAHLERLIKLEDRRHDRAEKGLAKAEKAFQRIVDRFENAGSQRARQRIAASQGIYAAPDAPATTFAGIQAQISKLFTAANRISSRRLTMPIQRMLRNIDTMTGDNGLIAQLGAAIERQATRLATDTQLLSLGLQRVRRRMGRGSRRFISDSLQRIAPISELDIAEREVDAQQQTNARLMRLRGRQTATLRRVEASLRRAERGSDEWQRLTSRRNELLRGLDDTDAKIATGKAAEYEKLRAQFEAQTDAALKPSQRTQQWADFLSSVGQTLGRDDLVSQATNSQLEAAKQQQKIFGDRYKIALERSKTDPAMVAVAEELGKNWMDASKNIVELQAKQLTDQIAAIENTAERAIRGIDIRGRAADLQERLGNVTGAITARQGLNTERIGVLQNERNKFAELRDQAETAGNFAVMKDLIEKIETLDGDIAELNATSKDLVAQYRAAVIEAIRTRIEGQSGWVNTATGIINKIGEVAGVTDTEKIRGYLDSLTVMLTTAAKDIGDEINKALNNGEFTQMARDTLTKLITAFNTGPAEFADALAGAAPDFEDIFAGLTPEEADAFNALITAMSANTEQVLDNTKALNDLSGRNPQSWSSSSWQWFRSAIFSGMGDILPQYQIPQMAVGGYVTKKGIFELHPGEAVIPNQNGSVQGGDTNVYITEPMEVADPLYLAKRIEWERSNGK